MLTQADVFEKVTIRTVEDIRPAAIAVQDAAAELQLCVAATADIASKEQIVDACNSVVKITSKFHSGFIRSKSV